MFSPSVLRIIIVVALAAHGIAHAIALSGLIGQCVNGASASQATARTWLLPGLGPNAAATVAIPFWLVAAVGFLVAAMSFWGIFLPDAAWRQIAVGAALASIVGIALFAGTWPGSPTGFQNQLNIGIAITMDVVILATQVWLTWPAHGMFGK